MMVKNGRPNVVKTSPFRKEIEDMLIEGKPVSFIMAFLKRMGNPISKNTLYRYKENFNPHEEAVQEYIEEKSIERFDTTKKKIVSDLEFCDNLVQIANEVGLEVDNDNKITKLDVNKLALQAIKAKNEIIKSGSEDEKEFTIIIKGVDSDEDNNLETEQETSQEHTPEE